MTWRVCAQRLSASRNISAAAPAPAPAVLLQCSTPFGITEYIGARPRRAAGWRQVLNAFRHHGIYRTSSGPRIAPCPDRCSTPFGITEYIGRKAASEHDYTVLCSTPFGITEYIGRGAARHRGGPPVLNAFRHHGIYRSFQRLPKSIVSSAQRLSASRNISAGRRTESARGRSVLNAFRHHGIYRARQREEEGVALCAVLNAFRHHGIYRLS